MGKLVIKEADGISREYPVGDTFTIGRALHCNLSLNQPGVSPHHAQIIAEPHPDSTVYRIRDLYSHCGTYLNERPVSHHDILKHEDVLKIGECELVFLSNSDTPEATSL